MGEHGGQLGDRESPVIRALLALLAVGIFGIAPAESSEYRRAYYLFLAEAPKGCEDCYVPLLIGESTLEELAASGRAATSVLITTYERDSIWTVERGVSLRPADVAVTERVIRLRAGATATRRLARVTSSDCWRSPRAISRSTGRCQCPNENLWRISSPAFVRDDSRDTWVAGRSGCGPSFLASPSAARDSYRLGPSSGQTTPLRNGRWNRIGNGRTSQPNVHARPSHGDR